MKKKFYLALVIFSLMGQVAWVIENMYFNVFIYKMFNATASDIANMVMASAVTATLTTVFMGALSDKIGKRKLFICLGYILWGISIFAFTLVRTDIISQTFALTVSAASVGVSLTIILDCLMTFFGSTANDAAFNAWLTDSTDKTNQGTAEGINSMMPLVSILVVFGGFMFFDLEKAESWTLIFAIIGVLTTAIGVLGFFIIKEPKIAPVKENYFGTIFYGFLPKTVKENKKLYISLLGFVVFNTAIQIFMPYLIIYYEKTLQMQNYVFIMAPAIILASVATAMWGKVYDKKGFAFSGSIALLSLLLGFVTLFLFTNTALVFVGSLLMMCGYLCTMAVFGACIRNHTPNGKSGRLQGVRIFSQVLIPGIVGPFIGQKVLQNAETIINSDGTESFLPNRNIFLAALVVAVFVIPFFITRKKPTLNPLSTDFETDPPFDPHPSPQLKRPYLSLNGEWDFEIKGRYKGKIIVPFVPESRASGVEMEIKKSDTLIYQKTFSVSGGAILHFGACDGHAKVFLNGEFLGENKIGYTPFSFDISHLLKEENTLLVEVTDPLCKTYPYGKQTNRRGGMWYTKVSGIWQSVWVEKVCENYVKSLTLTPDLNGVLIKTEGGESEKTILLNGEKHTYSGNEFYLKVNNPIHWTPENPHLYDFTLTCGDDEIESYFALRTVEVKDRDILLNGKPYFFSGVLDQGYFPDGIFLPHSDRGYYEDVLKMKNCGFNMLRKHIKTEPEIFYYYCDKLGMAVFQDFVNSGRYSFLIDTALPTVFLKKGVEHFASKKRKKAFFECAEGVVKTLYNHPCVLYYTIFNEGWGQFEANKCHTHFKNLDPTRVYDTTSGWFKAKETDVESDHVYFKKINLKPTKKPMVLSEFGGYSYKLSEHSFNLTNTYGYRFFEDGEKFENAMGKLYNSELLPMVEKGLCATVLTQLSDVEDETNGLLTFDRKVQKISAEKMQNLNKNLYSAFQKIHE